MFKSRIAFFSVLILISAAYTGGCRRAGHWLVKDDVPTHADAMVLLMGSIPDRVMQAADLYSEGRAGRMILVEETMGPYQELNRRGAAIIRISKQVSDAVITLGIPADSITVLPGDARSTLDEVSAVRDYLAGNKNIDTIIIVTSAPHTRRAAMIFRVALRNSEMPIFVGVSPSVYTNFNADRWWRSKEDIQAVLSEFVKIGSFFVVERRGLRGKGCKVIR